MKHSLNRHERPTARFTC